MKIKFSHILASATIVLLTLLSFASVGQDGGFSNELQDANHQELNLNEEDKPLIYEPEVKWGKGNSTETIQTMTPAKAKKTDSRKTLPIPNSNTKEGDDALSFNFLFYIIQKYKFADMIDQ